MWGADVQVWERLGKGFSVVGFEFQLTGNHKSCPYGEKRRFRMGASLNVDNRMTLQPQCFSWYVVNLYVLLRQLEKSVPVSNRHWYENGYFHCSLC